MTRRLCHDMHAEVVWTRLQTAPGVGLLVRRLILRQLLPVPAPIGPLHVSSDARGSATAACTLTSHAHAASKNRDVNFNKHVPEGRTPERLQRVVCGANASTQHCSARVRGHHVSAPFEPSSQVHVLQVASGPLHGLQSSTLHVSCEVTRTVVALSHMFGRVCCTVIQQ